MAVCRVHTHDTLKNNFFWNLQINNKIEWLIKFLEHSI